MEQTKNKMDLKNIIKDLPSIAEKGNWIFTYDEDEGALFYAPREIPDGSALFRMTDEYSLYLNERNNHSLEGMFVECFDKNFIEHHEEFKTLSAELFKINSDSGADASQIVVNPHKSNSDNAAIFRNLFEKTLISETFAVA